MFLISRSPVTGSNLLCCSNFLNRTHWRFCGENLRSKFFRIHQNFETLSIVRIIRADSCEIKGPSQVGVSIFIEFDISRGIFTEALHIDFGNRLSGFEIGQFQNSISLIQRTVQFERNVLEKVSLSGVVHNSDQQILGLEI